jgi:3-oxoacid CoA-transferase B subunit
MTSTGLSRELVALRVAREFRDGMFVNLGIGLPTLAANFIPDGIHVTFHAENGILGYGGIETDERKFDYDLIDAGGQPITLNPGAAFVHSADSFGMVRGGHLDLAVLGGLQVSERGDLANWNVPSRKGGAIGGAMDIAVGAARLIVAMEHTTRDGEPRILRACSFPLTASGCVDLIVTNLAVIEVTERGLALREVAPGVTVDEVQAATDAPLLIDDVREMTL